MDRLQHSKTHTLRSIRATISRFKHRDSRVDERIVTASTIELALPSLVHDRPPHSRTVQVAQHEEKDTPATVPLYPETNQRNSADTKDVVQTSRESEEEVENLLRHLSGYCETQPGALDGSNYCSVIADRSSDSDIIMALQRLNAELQQNTSYMADCLAADFEFKNVTTNPTMEQISAMQRASNHIGRMLAGSLGKNEPEDIPMLLQIALQAYLASTLCEAVSSWAFEPSYNAFIHGIYQRLRRAGEKLAVRMRPVPADEDKKWLIESQAISGCWRSLARVHTVHSWNAHPESLVKGILTNISDILLAAGCTAPQSDIIPKVTSKFEEKITLLVQLAGLLSKMFDGVISSDFEVFISGPGEKFEEKMMEDMEGDQAGIQEASVLCTTHLGLTKRLPVGTLWERGRKQKIMVVKARVLLESSFTHENHTLRSIGPAISRFELVMSPLSAPLG
jgi:hypothetical protein